LFDKYLPSLESGGWPREASGGMHMIINCMYYKSDLTALYPDDSTLNISSSINPSGTDVVVAFGASAFASPTDYEVTCDLTKHP